MKRVLCILVAIFMSVSFVNAAQEQGKGTVKKISYFADLGIAFADFKGLYLDVGAEWKLTNSFSAQAIFDYYMNPIDVFEDWEDLSSSAYGLGVYGQYKLKLLDKLALYAKAGLHCDFVALNWDLWGEEIELDSKFHFGLGAGAGVDYKMNDMWAITGGLTFRTLFGDPGYTWFVISGGAKITI